jgi:GntR family transcriptional repressor for pyruvate dehydrogenase complex
MKFNNIQRNSVVDEIIGEIKRQLISGDLEPGQKLPSESELVESFGVGRGALREAMKMLGALGVVKVQRGDGTYIVKEVTSNSLNELVFQIILKAGMNLELLELRELLQIGYCQLCAKKATDEELEMIENAANEFESLSFHKGVNIKKLTQADMNFHYSIIDATKNPLVIRISRAIEELFFGAIQNTVSNIIRQQEGPAGHQRILNAIKERNPEKICNAVKSSLERLRNDLSEASIKGASLSK